MQSRLQQRKTVTNTAALVLKLIAGVLFLMVIFGVDTAGAKDAVTLKYNVSASYTLGPGDSKALAHKLALFRAKYKATRLAARQFAQNRWVQFENGDQNELTALVAEELSYDIMADRWQSEGQQTTYIVNLQAFVSLSDFIDAQLEILDMAHKRAAEDLRHEMEPPLPEFLKPGHALAKAYWLMRIHEIRLAIIYIDGLIHQYPNWQEAIDFKKSAIRHQKQTNLGWRYKISLRG